MNNTTSERAAPCPANASSRFRLYRWDQLAELPEPSWLVKGLIPQSGFSLLVGKSGSNKTFLAIDLAAHIALGRSWCNRSVTKGGVLFMAAEGGRGIRHRFDAWASHHNIDVGGVPLRVMVEPIDLCLSKKDIGLLISSIRQHEGDLRQALSLIVVDTANAVMPGADENAPKDMGLLIRNCERLIRETDASVLLIHHLGKEAKKGARGHSSLHAAVDTVMESSASGQNLNVSIKKQRDGETGISLSFRLIEVNLGSDAEGDPISSAVLTYTADGTSPRDGLPKFEGKLAPAQNIAYKALKDALEKDGQPPPQGEVPEAVEHVVDKDTWRRRAYELGISSGQQRAKQKAFERAIEALVDSGLVGNARNWCWLVTPN